MKKEVHNSSFQAFPEHVQQQQEKKRVSADPFAGLPLGPKGLEKQRQAAANINLRPDVADPGVLQHHFPQDRPATAQPQPPVGRAVPATPAPVMYGPKSLTTQLQQDRPLPQPMGAPAMQHPPQPQRLPNNPQQVVHQHVQNPGFVGATSNHEALSMELPSRFAFYDFKDLYVRPFRNKHLAKLSRAREERSTFHMVEAVSSVLSTSDGRDNLAFQLTMNDFYFVLYWLRMNSFTKTRYTHTSHCTNPQHIEDVAAGKLSPDSLTTGSMIENTSLAVTMLDSFPDPSNFVLQWNEDNPDRPIWLSPPTMQRALEVIDDPRIGDEDFRWLAQISTYLNTEAPMSFAERMLLSEELDLEDTQVVLRYEKMIPDYGVAEKIQVTCRGCGASKADRIQLDPHSFFPSVEA